MFVVRVSSISPPCRRMLGLQNPYKVAQDNSRGLISCRGVVVPWPSERMLLQLACLPSSAVAAMLVFLFIFQAQALMRSSPTMALQARAAAKQRNLILENQA